MLNQHHSTFCRPTNRSGRSAARVWIPAIVVLLSLSTGCGSSSLPPASNPTADPGGKDGSQAVQSSEWDQQVKAVAAGKSARIEISSETITDRQFADVAQLNGLRELLIEKAQVGSDSLRHLAGASLLDHLRLRGARITDTGIRHLARLAELRVLNLPQADFTDKGLETIAALPNLELLRFGSPRVTDQGFKLIAGMKGLRFLHTIGVPVSDRGLELLQPVAQIESLYLDQSKVTDDGLSRLIKHREAHGLPRIHLHINQQHHDLDPRRHQHQPQ